jgi:hypothetical protein
VHAHLRRGDAALVIAGVAAEENARLIDLQCADRPPARAGLSATPSTVSSRGRPSAELWWTGAIPTVGRDVAH